VTRWARPSKLVIWRPVMMTRQITKSPDRQIQDSHSIRPATAPRTEIVVIIVVASPSSAASADQQQHDHHENAEDQ
jgi:hypothetical protein